MSTPTTSAGRFLRAGLMQLLGWDADAATNAVADIETEAIEAYKAKLRTKVEGLLIADPTIDGRLVNVVYRGVLRLIDEAAE